MSANGVQRARLARLDELAERRLVRLLFVRLSLTVLSFGIAIGLDGLGSDLPASARQGLYLTVAVAFASSIVFGLGMGRVRRVDNFAAMQIAADVGIVTSLVHFSGGRDSIFTFLYVVVALYGAVLFDRRGAIVAATLSAIGYGGVLFGAGLGLFGAEGDGSEPAPVLLAIWGVHVGALYLVGVLASLLSSELQRTGRALDQSTSDLHRLRNLHQRTIESIMSGLLTLDRDGCVTSFNPEAERITGLPSESALGRSLDHVIPGASPIVFDGGDQMRRGGHQRARITHRNAAGEELYLGLASSILKDRGGEGVGHVVIFQDVTEVVAMECELRSSERLAAVGEMAAKIAHEVRNPLASMSGAIQLLQGELGGSAQDVESHRLMDIVLRETDRLNQLITEFLQYSRPPTPDTKAFRIWSLLEEVVDLLETSLPDDIEIRLEGDSDLLVEADAGQLEQVVWNLSVNGIQAMSEGGILRISVDSAPGDPPQDGAAFRRNGRSAMPSREGGAGDLPWVEISISDSGPGIPEDVRERIFEPFFTTKRGGTGLGLATVHRIVESHGGALIVHSEEGRGTTFQVVLSGAGGIQ